MERRRCEEALWERNLEVRIMLIGDENADAEAAEFLPGLLV